MTVAASGNGNPADVKAGYAHRYVLRTEHAYASGEQAQLKHALRSRLKDFYAWSEDDIAIIFNGDSVVLQTQDSIRSADFHLLFCEKTNIELVPLMSQEDILADLHTAASPAGTKAIFDSLFSGVGLRRMTGIDCGLIGMAGTRDTVTLQSRVTTANAQLRPFGFRLAWSVHFPEDNPVDSCMLWCMRDITPGDPRAIHPSANEDRPDKVTLHLSAQDKLKLNDLTSGSSSASPLCIIVLVNGSGYASVRYAGPPGNDTLTVYDNASPYHRYLFARLHLAALPGKIQLVSFS